MTKYKVKLTYFKCSGKYYSEGEYESSREHPFEIFLEAREMLNRRKRPGLVDGENEFFVVVDLPDHPSGYPCLIAPDNVFLVEAIGNSRMLERIAK